jgi:hypothetical protein
MRIALSPGIRTRPPHWAQPPRTAARAPGPRVTFLPSPAALARHSTRTIAIVHPHSYREMRVFLTATAAVHVTWFCRSRQNRLEGNFQLPPAANRHFDVRDLRPQPTTAARNLGQRRLFSVAGP